PRRHGGRAPLDVPPAAAGDHADARRGVPAGRPPGAGRPPQAGAAVPVPHAALASLQDAVSLGAHFGDPVQWRSRHRQGHPVRGGVRAAPRSMTRPDGGVLVLDGYVNYALACTRSLGRAGYTVFVASDRRWPLAAWSHYCEASFLLEGETIAAFAKLRAWAVDRGVRTVLPLTERSCLLCDAERQAWESAGITEACRSASHSR